MKHINFLIHVYYTRTYLNFIITNLLLISLQVTNMRVAVAFFQSMFVIFALSFVPASFVVFLIGKNYLLMLVLQ